MGKVVYIDDDEGARETYTRALKRVFGPDYDVVPIEPSATLEEMVHCITKLQDVVSFVVDEKLLHTGVAVYKGSQLVERIRDTDEKIPVYILTSDVSSVDSLMGEVEFVIDKHIWQDDAGGDADKLTKRVRRHLNTFHDIKSARSERLSQLIKKSLESGLTEEEQNEFDQINLYRSKSILLEEQHQTKELKDELNRQEAVLAEIQKKMDEMQ